MMSKKKELKKKNNDERKRKRKNKKKGKELKVGDNEMKRETKYQLNIFPNTNQLNSVTQSGKKK